MACRWAVAARFTVAPFCVRQSQFSTTLGHVSFAAVIQIADVAGVRICAESRHWVRYLTSSISLGRQSFAKKGSRGL
jgi:hypothetical protein